MYLYRIVVRTNNKMFVLCFYIFNFSGKNTKDDHLSTLVFVCCRLPVTQFTRNAGDIDTRRLLIYFTIDQGLTCLSCYNQNVIKLENLSKLISTKKKTHKHKGQWILLGHTLPLLTQCTSTSRLSQIFNIGIEIIQGSQGFITF